jgi:hypothetical protein
MFKETIIIIINNEQRAITPKLGAAKLMFFALHFYPMRYISTYKCLG